VEAFFRTLKLEQVYLTEYVDFDDAYRQIESFIEDVYSRKRIKKGRGKGQRRKKRKAKGQLQARVRGCRGAGPRNDRWWRLSNGIFGVVLMSRWATRKR